MGSKLGGSTPAWPVQFHAAAVRLVPSFRHGGEATMLRVWHGWSHGCQAGDKGEHSCSSGLQCTEWCSPHQSGSSHSSEPSVDNPSQRQLEACLLCHCRPSRQSTTTQWLLHLTHTPQHLLLTDMSHPPSFFFFSSAEDLREHVLCIPFFLLQPLESEMDFNVRRDHN